MMSIGPRAPFLLSTVTCVRGFKLVVAASTIGAADAGTANMW